MTLAVCALVAFASATGSAQTPGASGDPSRRLAQSLAAQVRAVLDARREALPLLVVAPVADPTGTLAGGAKRAHGALVLELAKVPSMRISTTEPGAATDDAWVLATTLDVTREAAVLTGRLGPRGASSSQQQAFLAALPASPAVVAALARAGGAPGKVTARFTSAGEVDGPARAATSAQLRGAAADELVVVGDVTTRALALEDGAFHESLAVAQPRPDSTSAATPSRDPRAGVVALARGAGPADLWIRGPRGPAFVWRAEGAVVNVLRRADDVPLAAWPSGGALLGRLARGTNVFERLAVAAGPNEPARELEGHGGESALEASIGDGWLAVEDPSGVLAVEPAGRPAERVVVGRFGSAIAVLDGHADQGVWVLGDRDDGATLVVTRVLANDVDEVWRGAAPFRLCALVPGRFTGRERPELAAIGCEARAALALVTIEEEP